MTIRSIRHLKRGGFGVDVLVELFARLTGTAATCGETIRNNRQLRWTKTAEVPGDGQRGPVVLMESGLGEPTLTWTPVLAGLAKIAGGLVVYDRAGIGLSGPAHGDHSGQAQLADLAAVIEAVGCPPCVLVGHSQGGWLTQALAWRRPDLLAGVVLIDPSHEELYRHLPEEMLSELKEGSAVYANMSADAFIASQTDDWPAEAAQISGDAAVQSLIVDAWRACFTADDRVRAIYEEETAVQRDLPWKRALREVGTAPKMPSVVLSATTGLPDDTRALFTALQRQIAADFGGAHQIVADAGHYIHVDRPQAVVDGVARVVEAVRAVNRERDGG
jgi:pimeloyl-ACP methyl ester carboxylesterase